MALTEQELAQRAVERGLITQEQLDACAAERRQLRKDGLEVGLRELLQDRGLVDGARWDSLADQPAKPPAAERHPQTRSDADLPGLPQPPQEVLGGYRIVSELGRGAMGIVYEAIQERLGRRVALKVLPQTQALQGVARERFMREAQATASLKHPGIVPIYDTGEERGVHFFAMELLEGRSLKRILDDEGPLAPERAAKIIHDAAEALDFAHEHGVIHRDVKPDNIFARADGSVVLTDFGLAHREHDTTLTREGTIVGTPLYMAPEQARGDGAPVDRRADVYGLGITLYELLAGAVPFENARDTGALLDMVTHEEPPPLSRMKKGLPDALCAIVEVAIEKDPARRYPTAGALGQDLARFLAGEPIAARPPTRLTRTWRLVRRRGRTIAIVGAVVSLVLGLGGSLHVLRRRWHADNLVLDAIRLMRAGQRDAAEEELDRALEQWPSLPEAHFRKGELAVTPEEARRCWDLTLAYEPEHVEALLARGRLSQDAGDHEAALADFEAARRSGSPVDPRPALQEGLALLALGRATDAIARLREGLEAAREARATRDPLYAEAVLRLGELELAGGNAAAALTELEEAVRLMPQVVGPQVLLAQALIERGNDPAAVEALSAALRRDPTNLRAQELRGRAYRRLGQTPEAFRDLTAAKDLPTARLARGLLRFETVDFIKGGDQVAFDDLGAREDLEAAASERSRLSPRDRAAALLALGWLEMASPRAYRSRALERLDEAAALAPEACGPALGRALVLLDWDEHLDEAEVALQAALSRPGATYAAKVGLARVAEAKGDLAGARRLLDEAVALAPARETAYGYRYRLRVRSGDPQAAEDREKAIARRETAEAEPPQQFGVDTDPLGMSEHLARRGYAAFIDAVREGGEDSTSWAFHLTRAGALLGRAQVLDPWNLPASARHASVLYLLGEFQTAAAAYSRANVVDPSLHEAQLLRGVLERDMLDDGGPKPAEVTLRHALEAQGIEAGVRAALCYELARSLTTQGRLEEALVLVEQASDGAPRRHCVASLRARLRKRLGQPFDEAVERSATLFAEGERDRLRGRLYARAGQRLEDLDRFRAAEHFLTRAIEADPQNALAWRVRASVRFRGSASDIPSAFLDTYVSAELDPRYSERFLDVESRLHRFTTFLGSIEQRIDEILDENPDMPAAYFFKGYVTFHQGRYADAEAWFDRTFELSRSKSYMALAYRGAARMRQGRVQDAEQDLDRANGLYGGSPMTMFWRACLRARTGDNLGALQMLEDCAQRGFFFPEQIKAAPELEELRRDPRLRRLMRG